MYQIPQGPNGMVIQENRSPRFTDDIGNHQKWKASVWSPTWQVLEAIEGEGESSQSEELKAIELALEIAE
ncbi:hypothetical protein GRJ2_000115500 [Grus japonensis]|uniref:RNase H type-1 domain-containing protein n=1 Tax=Grus japonensis TaxID=30415 RepID=A0ABC9VUK0_GRUJA